MRLGIRTAIKTALRPKPALIVVLGMHRSGTSAVTEALASTDLPLNLGNHLLGGKPQNPHGFFEDTRVIRANKDFYEFHGAHVMEPWNLPSEFTMAGTERIGIVFEKLLKEKINIIKDPRLCVTLPQWQQVWGNRIRPTYLHIWRHPAEVALSLHKRDGLSIDQAERVWLTHVVTALRHADLKRSVFMMHSDLLSQPEVELHRVATEVSQLSGLSYSQIRQVTVDSALVTATTPGEINSPGVVEVWKALQEFHATGDLGILNQLIT